MLESICTRKTFSTSILDADRICQVASQSHEECECNSLHKFVTLHMGRHFDGLIGGGITL